MRINNLVFPVSIIVFEEAGDGSLLPFATERSTRKVFMSSLVQKDNFDLKDDGVEDAVAC